MAIILHVHILYPQVITLLSDQSFTVPVSPPGRQSACGTSSERAGSVYIV
ncbi:MAG TPA: hypothetical protein P5217_09090 [Methanoregulaceae archaeon]|nr:hypothetical protein [Methanoregulaceae archaeon]HPD75613.1 hypothetical protein [Methanoregulaceae archaeon]HRY76425.1 hypothetical protein [Methanoregulaceae archaeon]